MTKRMLSLAGMADDEWGHPCPEAASPGYAGIMRALQP